MEKYWIQIPIFLRSIDDETQIVDTVRRLVEPLDFIISTGGIGPLMTYITYEWAAKSFYLLCELR
nr:CMF_HP1_G0042520.mRNA.1.CDS.1 [Saccharomyces cerevisiae]